MQGSLWELRDNIEKENDILREKVEEKESGLRGLDQHIKSLHLQANQPKVVENINTSEYVEKVYKQWVEKREAKLEELKT